MEDMMINEDMLKLLFDIQRKHNKIWQDSDLFESNKEYRIKVKKDMILGIFDQTSDLLNTFSWGKHILESTEDVYNGKIELIDIAKFIIGLFILEGGTAEEFYQLFSKKSEELDKKWEAAKNKLTHDNDVVVFDIDGVLANYEKTYMNFLIKEKHLPVVESDRSDYSFYKTFGIKRQDEEKYHSEFIQEGKFLEIEPYRHAVSVVNELHDMGLKIILLTARPNWIFKRLTSDTRQWLDVNNFQYDLLLWNKDKSDAIINNVFPANVLYMIEDRDKHAIEVTHAGIDVLLIDKTYNRQVSDTERITRIPSILMVPKYVKEKLGAIDGK
jgi:uncharacterized HAD superfamily protein